MEIPIQNIYYLLCYAYNRLDEGQMIDVASSGTTSLADMFARVLVSGTALLMRRGLDRGYVYRSEDTRFIRGYIDFSTSIKRDLLRRAQVHCQYDELSYNVLHNQILKGTISLLCTVRDVSPELRDQLVEMRRHLADVSDVPVNKRLFRRVQLSSNNRFYDFILKICELIIDSIMVSEEDGTNRFRNFVRDENQMPALFEEFVRNFYRLEQTDYQVGREYVLWDATGDELSMQYLPRMQTDISMESTSRSRKIIIDTKYYKQALSTHYDTEKVHQSHLLQLFGYLKHLERKGGLNEKCDGVLLYPTVQKELDLGFHSMGHDMRVMTIRLDQDWEGIRSDLLAVVGVN